jgi:hypothetical protein
VLMAGSETRFKSPDFTKDIITIVGGYGSGKSEVAVNLSRQLATSHSEPVTIVDLDIVNPYFRSREAADRLAEYGIKSIVPKGGQFYADLPIILPEIKGSIESARGKVILDVGGDDVGAKILSTLAEAFAPDNYELLLVLNARRPFTSDVDGTVKVMDEIAQASRLAFTGIVSNTHLLEDTTVETIMEGYRLAQAVGRKLNLPVVFLSALSEIVQKIDTKAVEVPVLTLDRFLLKPWER